MKKKFYLFFSIGTKDMGKLVLLALCIFFFAASCKKDYPLSSTERHLIPLTPALTDAYKEFLLNSQAWDSLSNGTKFVTVSSKNPFIDFRRNTNVYLQVEGSGTWDQLSYVKSQNLDSTGNPDIFYTVKLEHHDYLPWTVVFVYARPTAPIDFSKAFHISVRVYP